MQRSMLLVCHAADGHFANGNRVAVRRLLAHTRCEVQSLGRGRLVVRCADGGSLTLLAPGLDGPLSFRRIELIFDENSWTDNVLQLVVSLMRAGGFGLLDGLDAAQVLVTTPEQIAYFPWLPEPPLLIRDARQLAMAIGQSALFRFPALAAWS